MLLSPHLRVPVDEVLTLTKVIARCRDGDLKSVRLDGCFDVEGVKHQLAPVFPLCSQLRALSFYGGPGVDCLRLIVLRYHFAGSCIEADGAEALVCPLARCTALELISFCGMPRGPVPRC
jgi:hypothetical protein